MADCTFGSDCRAFGEAAGRRRPARRRPAIEPSGASPRSAYIHVPFCRRRCGYCNFTVAAGREDLMPAYLEALERELSWLQTPREVDTLYLGGGTPSRPPPAALRRLLQLTKAWLPPSATCEWTVEANPEDVDAERVELLSELGVNRLSLGAQSFDPKKLAALERDHAPRQIRRAYRLVRDRFPAVSLDLIFAAPGETLDTWRRDLQAAVALRPDHISVYALTIERGSAFWGRRGRLARPGEELERAMYEEAIDQLTAAGFEHYEVANFAKPGRRCRHNDACWLGQPYYAAGPGAARYVDGVRETNHRSLWTYLKRVQAGRSPVAESERLSPEQSARERLVFGLRRLEGVDGDDFLRRTGFRPEQLTGRAVDRFTAMGLLEKDGSRVRLTRNGLLVSDAMWPDFLG